jgi:hypothetical protein
MSFDQALAGSQCHDSQNGFDQDGSNKLLSLKVINKITKSWFPCFNTVRIIFLYSFIFFLTKVISQFGTAAVAALKVLVIG